MATKIISTANVEHRKKLDIKPGDTVRVWQKIEEDKGKFRLQAFEGIVLACKHGKEAGATFTVRKVIDGVGVERIFPMYSPMIDEVELVRRSKVRRAKLYFIREIAAKAVRRQLRGARMLHLKSNEEITPEEAEVVAEIEAEVVAEEAAPAVAETAEAVV